MSWIEDHISFDLVVIIDSVCVLKLNHERA